MYYNEEERDRMIARMFTYLLAGMLIIAVIVIGAVWLL